MMVAVLIGILGILIVLGFIAYILDEWLYRIAKNQKLGYEEICKILKNKEN